jgi:uncharacterized repeat protein (TIGR03803 family)
MIRVVPRDFLPSGHVQFLKFPLIAAMVAALASGSALPAAAQQETVLHNFVAYSSDGYYSYAGVVFDAAGNLFGTTRSGGLNSSGTVFELLPEVGGGYKEKIVHNFALLGGVFPEAGLIIDSSGNLYGTTVLGGSLECDRNGCGTVFELLPEAGGQWTEQVLYTFNGDGADGVNPVAGLALDQAGNLYGTTEFGGLYGSGTVFELSPQAGGNWTETILHNFHYDGKTYFDGSDPVAGVTFDSSGNLYGTTSGGGTHNRGAVFEMEPVEGGGWDESVIYSFAETVGDGFDPAAAVVLDSAGNLYGTTSGGGAYGFGTVFELTRETDWSENILHSFNKDASDGAGPEAALTFDAQGNLWGTTVSGGAIIGAIQPKQPEPGTVFELTPTSDGQWTETFLFPLKGGSFPLSNIVFDASGNLYGTTNAGGTRGGGIVFEITP